MAERTSLTPSEEMAFQLWARTSGIPDVNNPEAHYDYRGFWKSNGQQDPSGHFPDTFKTHGHPTFSQESQYSRGPSDGGMWVNDSFVPQVQPAVNHMPQDNGLMQQLLQRAMGGQTQNPPSPPMPREGMESTGLYGPDMWNREYSPIPPELAQMMQTGGPKSMEALKFLFEQPQFRQSRGLIGSGIPLDQPLPSPDPRTRPQR